MTVTCFGVSSPVSAIKTERSCFIFHQREMEANVVRLHQLRMGVISRRSLTFILWSFFACVSLCWCSTFLRHLFDVVVSTFFFFFATWGNRWSIVLDDPVLLLICCRHFGTRDCSPSLWSTSVWPFRSYTSVCNTVATCCWSGATITAIPFHHPSLQSTTHFLVFHSLSQCPVLNLVIISKSSVNSADPLLQKTILTSVLQRMCTNEEDRDRLFADLVWFCPFL